VHFVKLLVTILLYFDNQGSASLNFGKQVASVILFDTSLLDFIEPLFAALFFAPPCHFQLGPGIARQYPDKNGLLHIDLNLIYGHHGRRKKGK